MNHHKPKMTKNKTLSIKNGLLSIFHFKANYFHTSQNFYKSHSCFLFRNDNPIDDLREEKKKVISKLGNTCSLLHLVTMEL